MSAFHVAEYGFCVPHCEPVHVYKRLGRRDDTIVMSQVFRVVLLARFAVTLVAHVRFSLCIFFETFRR
jgi:hypothetical protein